MKIPHTIPSFPTSAAAAAPAHQALHAMYASAGKLPDLPNYSRERNGNVRLPFPIGVSQGKLPVQ